MPLSFADIEEDNIIRKIGGSPEVKKHLENLGFVVGGSMKIVNRLGDNVIVNVKEGREEQLRPQVRLLSPGRAVPRARETDLKSHKRESAMKS